MEIGKKEKLLIGLGMLLGAIIFDWSNYFKFIGFVFIVLSFSDEKEESSEESSDSF